MGKEIIQSTRKDDQTDRNGVTVFLVAANLGKDPFDDKQTAVETNSQEIGNALCISFPTNPRRVPFILRKK